MWGLVVERVNRSLVSVYNFIFSLHDNICVFCRVWQTSGTLASLMQLCRSVASLRWLQTVAYFVLIFTLMLAGVALPPTVVCSDAHFSPTQWSLSAKGRTIRKLMGGGGAGGKGKLSEKKFMPSNGPQKIFMVWPKQNSYKEFDNEQKFLRLENSPPPPPP